MSFIIKINTVARRYSSVKGASKIDSLFDSKKASQSLLDLDVTKKHNKHTKKNTFHSPAIKHHPTKPARTRFAPSPTGFLHLGSLRTALYNYLLAKNTKGQFIIRLEDTDQNRLVEGAEENIYECLKWLHMENDEGPNQKTSNRADIGSYKQSERKEIYKKYVDELLDKKHAYKCFCSKERLSKLQESAQKLRPISTTSYDRACAHLTPEEVEAKERNGETYVVRVKSPELYPIIHDVTLGEINFQPSYNNLDRRYDDFVILKSDGLPTYHFANVVDDHLMEISHVVRGEEWIPSTPKHVFLYQLFGWKEPTFVHLPLLANSESNKKLSKRKNDSNIWELKKKGYLPEALLNFTALYGWSIPQSENGVIYNLNELVQLFNIDHLSSGLVKIQPKQLEFLNKQHLLRLLKTDEGIQRITQYIVDDNNTPDYIKNNPKKIKHILTSVGSTINKWTDFCDQFSYCYTAQDYNNTNCNAFKEAYNKQDITNIITYVIENIDSLVSNPNIIDQIQEDLKIKDKKIIFETIRYSLTSMKKGSAIVDIFKLLGKEEALTRLRESLKYL